MTEEIDTTELCPQKKPLYALKQLKIALYLAIGNLTTGYTASWPIPTIPHLKDPINTNLPYLILDSETTWITRIMIMGAIVGCIISGVLANKIGRKLTLLHFSIFNLFGYLLMAKAVDLTMMLIGRMFAGVASGSITLLNTVYLGEIASPELRGALIAMTGIMHVFGSLLVCSLGPHVAVTTICYVCVGISCVHVLAVCWAPESPVYQVMKGKHVEARITLHKLGRTKRIDHEIKLIGKDSNQALLSETRDRVKTPNRGLTRMKKNLRGLFMTTVLLCIQASSGRITAVHYAIGSIKNTFSKVDTNVAVIVIGLTELCGVIWTPLLVERCGRRFMLLISLGSCSLLMVFLETFCYFEVVDVDNPKKIISMKWPPIILLRLFLFAFNCGLAIVPNILSCELVSSPIRSIYCSLAMSMSWLALLCINFNYTDTETEYKCGIFWMYAVVNAVGFFFVFFNVPETMGKSLREFGF